MGLDAEQTRGRGRWGNKEYEAVTYEVLDQVFRGDREIQLSKRLIFQVPLRKARVTSHYLVVRWLINRPARLLGGYNRYLVRLTLVSDGETNLPPN